MDRRTFLKSVGAAISGLTGLLLLKAEPELTEEVLLDMINSPGPEYITFTGSDNGATMTVLLYRVDKDGNWHLIDQQTASRVLSDSSVAAQVRLCAPKSENQYHIPTKRLNRS